MRRILFWSAIAVAAIGCKKSESESGSKASDKPSEGGKAIALPALVADPDPGAITPAETPPFSTVTFRMLAKRGKGGWPDFDAYNLGTKPVAFLAITGYAYDKDGNQVARTSVPLSWNGTIPPGGKADWSLNPASFDDKVPATAVSYELCYHSIKYAGEADATADRALCPEQKPKRK